MIFMKEDTTNPQYQKLYSAREMSDQYIKGFEDGYNKALMDIQNKITDPGPECG